MLGYQRMRASSLPLSQLHTISVSILILLELICGTSWVCLCWGLWPSQPIRVMLSVVSLPNHTFTGQAQSAEQLSSINCAHSFARNWKLPFLNQQKGEINGRKYFMINLHKRMLQTWWGGRTHTSCSPVGRISNWAIEASRLMIRESDFALLNQNRATPATQPDKDLFFSPTYCPVFSNSVSRQQGSWSWGYKLFSCSTQQSMKFFLLIKLRLLTIATEIFYSFTNANKTLFEKLSETKHNQDISEFAKVKQCTNTLLL